MAFLSDYGLFLLEALTIVIAILITVAGIVALTSKEKPKMKITALNEEYQELVHKIQKKLMDKKTHKKQVKELKKKKTDHSKPRMFVIDFDGDIKASKVSSLRQEVSAILAVADEKDEVVVRIESPGGSVNGYGLAASQLQRIRDKGIQLTACVDKVAASGGYLMACVANNILAAPFAIIGSIGVVAQLPNIHRLLKKHNIDVEMLTAGEYKRTLTFLGQNTDKGRKKFQEDIELIHQSFRDYVSTNRHQIDIDKVATGEHWLARDAFELRLVDKLMTSDDYLIDNLENFNIFKVEFKTKPTIGEKVLKPAAQLLNPWA
jgi:serine protease SohB